MKQSKLIPPNPSQVMVIRKVTSNITTLSVPFLRFGRIKIGGRGTLVKMQSGGGVAVFSPVALTDDVKETVATMGDVRYIIAPDTEHHIFLGPWHEAYPNAKVIGPEGLPEKRAHQKNEHVPFSVVFGAKGKQDVTIDEDFDADFDYEYVDAHPNKELVFNYKPEKTLIEADLLFNLPATEQYSKSPTPATSGILTKFFSSVNHTRGASMGQKRFIWYLISMRNRKEYNKSVLRISKWDFDRIIPCHGDVIETGGKSVFQKIMEWNIAAAAKD